jgi:hypothetical protein
MVFLTLSVFAGTDESKPKRSPTAVLGEVEYSANIRAKVYRTPKIKRPGLEDNIVFTDLLVIEDTEMGVVCYRALGRDGISCVKR